MRPLYRGCVFGGLASLVLWALLAAVIAAIGRAL